MQFSLFLQANDSLPHNDGSWLNDEYTAFFYSTLFAQFVLVYLMQIWSWFVKSTELISSAVSAIYSSANEIAAEFNFFITDSFKKIQWIIAMLKVDH